MLRRLLLSPLPVSLLVGNFASNLSSVSPVLWALSRGVRQSRTVWINVRKMRNGGYSRVVMFPVTPCFIGVFSYFLTVFMHIPVSDSFVSSAQTRL